MKKTKKQEYIKNYRQTHKEEKPSTSRIRDETKNP